MSNLDLINYKISAELPEDYRELVSDGYHTFKELYKHRVSLFVALCNTYVQLEYHPSQKKVWKSRLHSDGTMFDKMFIAGIWTEKWDTLTYHLPISKWDKLYCDEIPNSPEWDWHTSDDVLVLLGKI